MSEAKKKTNREGEYIDSCIVILDEKHSQTTGYNKLWEMTKTVS